MIAPSCSLIHSPCDLDLETNEKALLPEIKNWMAFAKQKLNEIIELKQLANSNELNASSFTQNKKSIESPKGI